MLIVVRLVFFKLLELILFPQNKVVYPCKCCRYILVELPYLIFNVNAFTLIIYPQYASSVTYQLFSYRQNLITDLTYQLIVVVAMLPGLDRLHCLYQSAFNHHTPHTNIYPTVYTFYMRSSQRLTCSRVLVHQLD